MNKKIFYCVLLLVFVTGCSKNAKEDVPEEIPKVEVVKEQVDGVEEQVVEAQKEKNIAVVNNGGYYVEYDKGVYFWELNGESFVNEGLMYSENSKTVNNLVYMSLDGTKNNVMSEKGGRGKIFISGERLFLSRVVDEAGNSLIYSVSLDGAERREVAEGKILNMDEENHYLICEDGNRVFLFDIVNESQKVLTEDGKFLLYDDEVVYLQDYEDVNVGESSKNTLVHFKRVDLDDLSEKKITVEERLAKEDLGVDLQAIVSIPKIQVVDDYIYFAYGSFDGSLGAYQGGKIARVNDEGGGFEVLAGNDIPVDYVFYVLKENKKDYLIYRNQEETYSLSLDDMQVKKSDFLLHEMRVPFVEQDGISMYTDRTGKVTRLVNREDYKDFEISVEDVSETDKLDIKNVEMVGDWVYYTVEYSIHKPEIDIGFRYGYERKNTIVYRKNLLNSEVQVVNDF